MFLRNIGICHNIWRHVQKHSNLPSHCRENLTSRNYTEMFGSHRIKTERQMRLRIKQQILNVTLVTAQILAATLWRHLRFNLSITVVTIRIARFQGCTRQPTWLRHYATSRIIAGSFPDEVIGFFSCSNPSTRTMALGSTPPLNINEYQDSSWG
jgi:hypothetical protein